ncbi:MAG: flagellar hook-length control protein FliK [Peptococcaceae bacterium]|nr:flagellar hook-length control protein FliK [Peptococcaceae bacterium]
MENVMLRILPQELAAAGLSAGGRQSLLNVTQGQSTDPFLAVIQNMLAQMLEGSPEDPAAAAEGTPLMLNPQDSEEGRELMEAYAAMLAGASGVLVKPPAELAAELTQADTGQAAAIQPAADTGSGPATAQGLAAAVLSAEAAPKTPEPAAAAAAEQSPPGNFRLSQEGIPILEASYTEMVEPAADSGGINSEKQLFRVQSRFNEALDQVKKQLAEDKPAAAKEPEELDADLLQQQVNGRKTSWTERLAARGETEAQTTLPGQLEEGIRENLTLGKREFTLKLKPESLGEITVKLIEKSGKMTLTISAASAQTARLINSDLYALREAVRPLQVEVQEAVPQSPESSQSQLQQFDMTGQQFNRHQSFGGGGDPAYYPLEAGGEPAEEPAARELSGALDTYI